MGSSPGTASSLGQERTQALWLPGWWRPEVRGDPTSGFPSSTILGRAGGKKSSFAAAHSRPPSVPVPVLACSCSTVDGALGSRSVTCHHLPPWLWLATAPTWPSPNCWGCGDSREGRWVGRKREGRAGGLGRCQEGEWAEASLWLAWIPTWGVLGDMLRALTEPGTSEEASVRRWIYFIYLSTCIILPFCGARPVRLSVHLSVCSMTLRPPSVSSRPPPGRRLSAHLRAPPSPSPCLSRPVPATPCGQAWLDPLGGASPSSLCPRVSISAPQSPEACAQGGAPRERQPGLQQSASPQGSGLQAAP